MSVVTRNLVSGDEVNTMIASAFDGRLARRPRPSGFDRSVMRISLAMLLWARRRADRTAVSREEQIRRYDVQQATLHREHAVATLVARIY